MRKPLVYLLIALLLLAGCSTTSNSKKEITLEDVNAFLNESAGLGDGSAANAVAVIPIKHIDGPRTETDYYAFITYIYKSRDYIKYQVSYVSCTCRPPANNYWQTAFIELTLPESKDINDVEIKTLSYDNDAEGHYLGGFWGDSNPIPSGQTYEMIKEQYISYFTDKDFEYVKSLSVIDDIKQSDYKADEGRSGYEIDTLSGASVSANNIIRVLNAVMEYHSQGEYFAK